MSLINQALRKAQRDRTPNRMAQATDNTPSSATPSIQPGNEKKQTLVIGLVVALALLIGLVAGLSVVLFKGSPTPERHTTEIASQPETPAPTPITQPAKIKPPTQPSPRETPEKQATPNVIEELRLAREAAEAKAKSEAIEAEAAARKAAAPPSQDIINWLAKAQVTGVRLSKTGSKVILNGKTYEVGELVHYGLGLKVLVIQEKRILFIDANGKKYMKRI